MYRFLILLLLCSSVFAYTSPVYQGTGYLSESDISKLTSFGWDGSYHTFLMGTGSGGPNGRVNLYNADGSYALSHAFPSSSTNPVLKNYAEDAYLYSGLVSDTVTRDFISSRFYSPNFNYSDNISYNSDFGYYVPESSEVVSFFWARSLCTGVSGKVGIILGSVLGLSALTGIAFAISRTGFSFFRRF